MPIVRKQGNAFLAAPRVEGERFHYFETGIKRLIIELELEDVVRVPRAPVAQVPPAAVPAALPARPRQARQQAGDRRRRLQHLLGRPRDLPVHARPRACAAPTAKACPPSRPHSAHRARLRAGTATGSRSRSSTCPTCASRITGRCSATSQVRRAPTSQPLIAGTRSESIDPLAARHRCRRRRLADARQAGRVDQRPVARRHGGARRASSATRQARRRKALIVTSGEARLHRRRRHQGIRRHPHARPGVRAGSRAARQVLDQLEALPCPTVAAINGFALGGGLELALACRYRVLRRRHVSTLGLPEVQLGIHPGFGGTVRAVRCAGAIAAMEMMLTGETLRADKALRAGLVDRLAPVAQLEAAAREQIALDAAAASRADARCDRAADLAARAPCSRARCARAGRAPRRDREHYPAPYAIIDLWQRYGGKGKRAYEAEARSIAAAPVHADLAQPGARVLPPGSAEDRPARRREPVEARARRRRRRHGRRHRQPGARSAASP